MADVLKINMFGGLSVFYGEKKIVEHASRLNKPLELLALLILQQDKMLSNEQMMEELWGIDTLDNPVGALKTAIYSLRKILEQATDDDYIIMENGRYKWNKAIPVELDVALFEELERKILTPGTDDETQLKLGKKAISLYAGDLLPGLSDRQWMMGYSNLLRQNYLKVVTNTSKLLMATEDRAGNMMVVMLITITTKPRRVLPKQQVANAMLELKGVVKDILRKGDVFSRYSRNQYILMLPMNELDDAEVVERRILEGYDKQKTTDLFTLDIQSQELDTLV